MLVEIVLTQVLIGRLPLEEVVDQHQDAMAHRHHRPFTATPRRQPPVLHRPIALYWRPAAHTASASAARSQGLPLRVRSARRLPSLF